MRPSPPDAGTTSADSNAGLLSQTMANFLSGLAAKSPAPGGGAATALTGALAAALARMTIEYTLGKPKFQLVEADLTAALGQLTMAQAALQELIEEDHAAYEALAKLLKLTRPERQARAEYQPTVAAAIAIPESVGTFALAVLELCRQLLDKINPLLISDLGIAAELARATVHAARFNVLINLPLLDPPQAAPHRQTMEAQCQKADALHAPIQAHFAPSR